MNLLPKSHKEFGQKDYWNKFFKKRGTKAFEWYGEYLELCSQLHKYVKLKDAILITGCGNSSLSSDMYDVGFTNITNIDVSEVVIKQMQKINATKQLMKFICMDALNMSFHNEEFNVVIDKGTLDALMPDDSDESNQRIDKYFAEIRRVLKLGGRYVCISLLQEHIIKKVLNFFCDNSWMFRVVRCHEAEAKNAEDSNGNTLPVFIVIATKFKQLPQLILEICMAGEKMLRLKDVNEVIENVKSAQDAAVITTGLANTSLVGQDEASLTLSMPGESAARYTLYVLDQAAAAANKYAVFIVPQGRESEWLFGTLEGRRQLLASAKRARLVVATLGRGQRFDSLDAVKDELANSARLLAPKGFSGQIPFLSLGSDVGKREKVHEGSSETTGEFVVEDVQVDGATFRRLIFLDNQFLVQSEAKLRTVQSKGKPKTVVEYGHISSYHAYMSVGVVLATRGGVDRARVAVLGLGGGSLCMFLRKCFDKLSIVAVDIDETVYEIARQHFHLKVDDSLKVRIEDGIDFLTEEANKGSEYEAILFDMDSKDRSVGLSCPPRQFLHQDVLANVKKLLSSNGQFILNLVCRDAELHDSIVATLKQHFQYMVSINLEEEVNEVVFANNEHPYSADLLNTTVKTLNTTARNKNLVKIKCVDLKDFSQSVNIISSD